MSTRITYTAAELAALDAVAESWRGTPFCANSAVKGAGVSCHRLASEIYFGAGWLPRFEVPAGAPQQGRAGADPLMERWIDDCPHFVDIDPARLAQHNWRRALAEIVQPGYLVLSRPAVLPWHLSIALPGGRFVHAVMKHGVQIPPALPDAWAKRLWRIWAPRIQSQP